MRITKLLGILVAAAAMFVSAAQAAKIGETAPDFKLLDIKGKEVSLGDFPDQVVVLEWVNYGCPFVKKFYNEGHMQAMQEAAKEKGVVWLSICSSAPGNQGHMTADEWVDAAKGKGVNANVLIDEKGEVGKLYGAVTTPHMFVIDEKGVLAYNGAIDSVKSTKTADIATAKNYVVAAYESVLDGGSVESAITKPYGCSVKY
ncbi:thioredoxin family protein [Puniceicoccaceae bacterium K14]|nr:thioredoxin family protein [Puniceicoccaceae bacterium K14]